MRIITRFESIDGSLVLTLPQGRGGQSEGQSARLALARPPGMQYAADLQGAAIVIADTADIRVRATLVDPEADTDLDQVRSLLRRIGRGRLWMRRSDGIERWCWARAEELAAYEVSHESPMLTEISISFVRLSDWYAATQSVLSQLVTQSPATFNITSNGKLVTRQVEIEITAHAPAGFTNPKVRNVSAALEFTVQASSNAAGQKVRVSVNDNLSRRAQFYNGTAWSNVAVTLGQNQVELMQLVPGTQLIEVSGVMNGTVTVRWYDAFA